MADELFDLVTERPQYSPRKPFLISLVWSAVTGAVEEQIGNGQIRISNDWTKLSRIFLSGLAKNLAGGVFIGATFNLKITDGLQAYALPVGSTLSANFGPTPSQAIFHITEQQPVLDLSMNLPLKAGGNIFTFELWTLSTPAPSSIAGELILEFS